MRTSSHDSDSADSGELRLGIRALLAESTSQQQQQQQSEPLTLNEQEKSDSAVSPRHPRRCKRARVSTAELDSETESNALVAVGSTVDSDSSDDGGEASDALDGIFAWPSAIIAPSSPLTKAAIVRSLRAEEAKLEVQHKALLYKWRTQIADPSLLEVACEAARQRSITSKYEREQRYLREQLLLQQLYLASVQVALTESPLMKPHNSISIFQAIHDTIHLSAAESASERAEKLVLRSDLALKLAPSLVDRFANLLVHRATPLLPFTTSTMSADLEFTYLATISISKIECATVTRVFNAVMQYFNSLDKELGRHYNARHDIKHIQTFGPMRNYSQLRYSSDSPFSSVSNTVFAATLTRDQGLVVIDFVDSDDHFAEASRENDDGAARRKQRRDITVLLSITSVVDLETQRECVLVRHVRVHRFNLLPSSPVLLNEIKITQAYSNGDLFMAIVCRHLKETEAMQ